MTPSILKALRKMRYLLEHGEYEASSECHENSGRQSYEYEVANQNYLI